MAVDDGGPRRHVGAHSGLRLAHGLEGTALPQRSDLAASVDGSLKGSGDDDSERGSEYDGSDYGGGVTGVGSVPRGGKGGEGGRGGGRGGGGGGGEGGGREDRGRAAVPRGASASTSLPSALPSALSSSLSGVTRRPSRASSANRRVTISAPLKEEEGDEGEAARFVISKWSAWS